MSRVTASIEIEAPPERVWEVVMDPACFAAWVTIHRRLGPHTPLPLRRGSEVEQHLVLRGAPFTVHWTLAAVEPVRHATWEGRGPARSRARTVYDLRPTTAGTRFDYENEFRAPFGPLGAVASRAIVGGLPEREATRSLEQLKRLVER